MSFSGHVENGLVVFDRPVSLPDGTPVEVSVIDSPVTLPDGTEVEVSLRDSASEARPSLWDRLKDVVGKADGLPADASTRVDHYLTHGLPKK